MASLHPLARREFLQDLMETVAEQQVSVVLSSHLISDLERACDYVIVLADLAAVPRPGHHRRWLRVKLVLIGAAAIALAVTECVAASRKEPAHRTVPHCRRAVEPAGA